MNPSILAVAFGAGVLAGLGAVVPLGAMGVMLLTEGTQRGRRDSMPAAAGVAGADLLYCLLAMVAGSALTPFVSRWGKWPAALGGVLLIALAVLMFRRVRAGVYIGDSGRRDITTTNLARFGMFFGLTLINPFPLIYFAAVAVGLGKTLHYPAAAALFVVGVGAASLTWNVFLVSVGAKLRSRSTARVQRNAGLVGACIIGALGFGLLVLMLFR